MRDEYFIRGQVPMTKSEVRAVSLSKLELTNDSIVYDIGAGTGSVSIEAARAVPGGQVYAIEKNPEARKLIYANRDRFQIENLVVVEGSAPEVLTGLPLPSHAFIGGSSGCLREVIRCLLEKNPRIRIVVNLITLESLSQMIDFTKTWSIEAEFISIQVARAGLVGTSHLMQGQNPVYVISFGGTGGWER
ncbi:MAG: precorrin-6Y C5,15-methyltransferase (decarboxylating) subunit CbiT [Hungatella sp.]